MPSATSERVVKVDNFKGLNLRDPRNALDDHELSDCINYNLGTAGELAKRTGFKTIFDAGVNLLTAQESSFEGAGVGGWVAGTGAPTLAVSAVGGGSDGTNALAVTATAVGVESVSVNKAAIAGQIYTAMVDENRASASAVPITVSLIFKDAGAAQLGVVSYQRNTSINFTFTQARVVGTAPVGTVSVDLVVTIGLAGFPVAIGDIHYIDRAGIFNGDQPTWSIGGALNFGDNSVQMLGYFRTDTYQQFIATAGGEVYWSTNATTWTRMAGGPWGTVDFGTQYIDSFFMVRRNGTVMKWDGTTLSAIASSPSGSYCRVFKDRLFVLNSYGAGVLASRLYYSNIADFSATGWPATNYRDVGSGDGDWLIACYNIQDIFMVFKTGASWILYVQGDPTLWTLRSFNSEVGCISKNTIVLFEGVLYFCSIRGVFQTDGNTARIISTNISPMFNSIVISSGTINRASAFVWEDKFVLSLETFPVVPTWNLWSTLTWNDLAGTQWSGSGAQITYLVYHIRQKGWTKWALVNGLAPHTFISVILSSELKGVYSGDRGNNGKVIKFGDPNYTDDSVNYEVVAETKEFDFGSPSEMKRGKWLGVRHRGVGLHTFTHAVDGNAKAPVSITPTQNLLELKLKGPEFFRMWRIRSSATHPNPVTIFGFDLHMSKSGAIEDSRG